MTTALCPGSFDPPTLGHVDVFERAAEMFDRVVVAVVANPSKTALFSLDERVDLIRSVTSHLGNVSVDGFSGLVVEVARTHGASVIVKGIRSGADVDYEIQMAQMNWHQSGVETVLIPANARFSFVSSTLVREIAGLGGSFDTLVPSPVATALKEKLT